MEWSTLRIMPQRAVLVKSFPVDLDRVKLPVRFTLNAAAGLTYKGLALSCQSCVFALPVRATLHRKGRSPGLIEEACQARMISPISMSS